jgi:CAAX protease family protein
LVMADTPHQGPVASARHTVVLLLALVAVAISGAIRNPIPEWPRNLAGGNARVFLYLKIVGLQALAVGYVWLGLRLRRTPFRALIDDSPWTARRWLRYLAVGLTGWIAYLVVSALLSKIAQPSAQSLRALQAMLPHSTIERAVWAAFAIAVAVCEEVVYRGYLLQQFRAMTGSTAGAVLLQALGYSLVHLVLPKEMLPGIVILGLLLGGIAAWQKSLVPGMILHAAVGLLVLAQPS